jgi:AcrR family transcriptional regulator
MPKLVDHDVYREELLNKCFDIFAKKGYSYVTMKDLAKELNVSTGTFYHYFSKKESILEQMLLMATRRDVSEAIARIRENLSLEERIKILFDFVSERESYFGNVLLLTIDYYRFHGKTNASFDIVKQAANNYRIAIAESSGLDIEYGSLILIFLNGLIYHRLAFPGAVSLKKQTNLFKKILLDHIRSQGKAVKSAGKNRKIIKY